jgi:small conductance mechanosensitive channel
MLSAAPLSRLLPPTERLIEIGLRVGATVAVALVLLRILFFVIARLERFIARAGGGGPHAAQRARTLGGIFRNLAGVFVAGGALLHALEILGWNVGPLLAGAGLLGVAVGFGAQTLVRDVIAGLFILAEDQFGVGDVIEVSGRPATVEEITVRMTRLRDDSGFVHFVPNGEMRIVTNRSRGWHRLAFDIVLAAGQDLDRALGVVRGEVEAFHRDPLWRERLLDPVAVLGIEGLTTQEAQIRLTVRAASGGAAFEVARELKRRIHHAVLEAGLRTDAIVDARGGAGSAPAAGTHRHANPGPGAPAA